MNLTLSKYLLEIALRRYLKLHAAKLNIQEPQLKTFHDLVMKFHFHCLSKLFYFKCIGEMRSGTLALSNGRTNGSASHGMVPVR